MEDSATAPAFRAAPPGFTEAQRAQFDRDGILVLEGAIGADDVARYLDAIDRVVAAPDGEVHPVVRENIVELDPDFEDLIDHDRHVGFVYDLFGEQLMLHSSQIFVRPGPSGPSNQWHPDGPRAVPYGVFTDRPVQVKIAYWLTDVPEPGMANLVVRPGSQNEQYFDDYDTWEPASDELVLCPRAGDMLVMNGGVWHRVEPNHSDRVRKNLFVTYCPSWIVPGDRYLSTKEWVTALPRERRIIMRSYRYAYSHAKPPAKDFPLFLDRDTGLDHDPGRYKDHVRLERRKRLLPDEKR